MDNRDGWWERESRNPVQVHGLIMMMMNKLTYTCTHTYIYRYPNIYIYIYIYIYNIKLQLTCRYPLMVKVSEEVLKNKPCSLMVILLSLSLVCRYVNPESNISVIQAYVTTIQQRCLTTLTYAFYIFFISSIGC